MVVLDAMEKCAGVRVLETELNDSPGVCMKLYGRLGDIESAARAAEETASAMQTPIIAHVIPSPSELSPAAYQARPEFSPLIEQATVQRPENDMKIKPVLPWVSLRLRASPPSLKPSTPH